MGPELVACRIAVTILIEFHIHIQKFRCKLLGWSIFLDVNESQVRNCSLPLS